MGWRRRWARWSSGLGWSAFALALLPLLLAVVGKGFGLARPSFWGDHFLLATWLSATGLAVLAAALKQRAWRADGRLARAGGDLAVVGGSDGARRLRCAEVEAAIVVRGPASTWVELSLGDGQQLVASVENADEARDLLGRTGIDPGRRRARLEIDRVARWVPVLTALGLSFVLAPALLPIGAASAAGAVAWVALLAASLSAALVASSAVEVVVGTDGLQLTRGRTRRFIPLEGVRAARASVGGLELIHDDGRAEHVALYWMASPERIARRDAIVASIEEALGARRAADEAATGVGEALARGDRSLAEWRSAVDALVRGAGYRARSLTSDVLSRIVEHPALPVDRRIGAALALAARGDLDGPDRIRVAARSCAEERVRIALEQVADGAVEDAAIEEALGADGARRVV
jgi:hypothetical protein